MRCIDGLAVDSMDNMDIAHLVSADLWMTPRSEKLREEMDDNYTSKQNSWHKSCLNALSRFIFSNMTWLGTNIGQECDYVDNIGFLTFLIYKLTT